MSIVTGNLTVFFENPFWIGVFERFENEELSAAKVIFGSEPKDFEVYEFILKNYFNLKFSPPVSALIKQTKKNPKRIKRDVKKHLSDKGIGTKSQQALKIQHEQYKEDHKIKSRQQKEAESKRQFQLKQQKKKQKHKGR